MKKEKVFSLSKKDYRVDTFKSGGKGGQHQNTTDSGVRITHLESGAVAESRSERSQHRNKSIAFERLHQTPKFKTWLTRKVFEVTGGKTLEQKVDESMILENLKIETHDDNGRWV